MAKKAQTTIVEAEEALHKVECGIDTLTIFEDAISNGASDHSVRLERCLNGILMDMREASGRLRAYIDKEQEARK